MPTENRSSELRDLFIKLSPLGLDDKDMQIDGNGFEHPATEDGFHAFRAGHQAAQQAQQHQGEAVALPAGREWNGLGNAADNLKAAGWNACLMAVEKLGPLYTHADPAEVERLRQEIAELEQLRRDEVSIHTINEVKAEALLAEAHALLLRAKNHLHIAGYANTSDDIGRYLSASAEPQPPQSEPEKPRRCASCDNCQGFTIGHDSSQQLPYSIRCENCNKEARAAEHASLASAWNALNQAASAEPSAPCKQGSPLEAVRATAIQDLLDRAATAIGQYGDSLLSRGQREDSVDLLDLEREVRDLEQEFRGAFALTST